MKLTKKQRRLLFYILFSIIPIAQASIFYIYVNINTIVLAFQDYDLASQRYVWAGISNFKRLFESFAVDPTIVTAFCNSLIAFFVPSLLIVPIGVLNGYYFYKHAPLSGVFQVFYYLPTIISSLIIAVLGLYGIEELLPEVVRLITGTRGPRYLSDSPDTIFPTLLVFNIFIGWGGSGVILYPAAMSAVSPELREQASLDGCGSSREFIHVIFPAIYPTFVTLLIVRMTTLFTNDLNLFAFLGNYQPAQAQTIGYYSFTTIFNGGPAQYPYMATFGLILTLILAPTVLLTRKLLEKIGPKEY